MGSAEWERVHVGEVGGDDQAVISHESLSGCANPLLAIGGEWEVCAAGVTAVEGPFGFAMADDEDSGDRHGFGAS